jgi:polyisoprenoid-binding protein YceI
MRRCLLVVFLCGLVAESTATEWRSKGDSSLFFEATFEGEPLPGEFQKFDVAFTFDKAAPDAATLVVTVELAAADMGDPDMNEVLFDVAWLDIETSGRAFFSSKAIRESSPGTYVATGILDLKGVQHSVTVPFEWQSSGNAATMRGRLSLNRTDFSVGSGEWSTGESIGLEVSLRFDVKLELSE